MQSHVWIAIVIIFFGGLEAVHRRFGNSQMNKFGHTDLGNFGMMSVPQMVQMRDESQHIKMMEKIQKRQQSMMKLQIGDM